MFYRRRRCILYEIPSHFCVRSRYGWPFRFIAPTRGPSEDQGSWQLFYLPEVKIKLTNYHIAYCFAFIGDCSFTKIDLEGSLPRSTSWADRFDMGDCKELIIPADR